LFKKQIDSLFKSKKGIENIQIKDEVFDNTVIKLPIDDTGVPFNPNDPLKQYGKPKKEEGIKTIEGQMEKINKASSRLDELIKEREAMFKPKKTDNETVQDLVDEKFGKGYFDTVEKPKFRLNVEKFKKDFNVADDEIERITKLSSDEQQKVLQDYIDKDFKERIELSDYDVTDLEPNAEGGRIGYNKGNFVKGIISLFKPKKQETVKSFLEKRKFLKSMVGETEKNKKARDLEMLKKAAEEARENPGFQFKNVDVDKILDLFLTKK